MSRATTACRSSGRSHSSFRGCDSADVDSTAERLDPDRRPAARCRSRAQSRLAKEISERIGGVVVALALELEAVVRFRLYENGRMVDEYLSVPTFYGELPKADELALEANPTLVARLTGADRDASAASPARRSRLRPTRGP